ncbi:transporter substrate-binding domain-containing protein [Vibrio sp. Isolate22]|uniref:transporter substrate-binding domain-containing protein n=1 Tax=Vibrio sp. Isolate22 TaxID=2908532 RepID=UPI001EFDB1F1|nr:transporter substrate-binding domain-containing protein [Vibrio sp. Isolate22]MCG9692333.1 transporter substrate-binding domain-containing protein [Vibrio sp. Isolate22]
MYVKMGRYDAVIDNASLQPFITGKNPTAHYALAIYVRSDFPQNDFSWEMLRGKVIGVVRGYDYTKSIRDFDGWIKEPTTTDELMLLTI